MAKDITVALELDNKQFNNALKQSQKNVKSFAQDSTTELGGLKSAFAGLVTAATLKSIVDVGASFQDLRNSLNIVFGSVQAGAVQFDRIKTFAAETQFSVQTLTQAFIQLKGAGIEPTEELLRTFADTSSVVVDEMGAFQAMLDLVSRSTAGGLGLEDLNRLADRGIPVFAILQEKLGLTRLEITEFGKTAEGAERIIDSLTEGLRERFGGALEQSAGNISRATNNLGDAFDNLQNALFGAFSDEATGAITALTDAINKLADNTSAIKDIVDALKGFAIAFAAFKGVKLVTGGMNALFAVLAGGSKNVKGLRNNVRQLFGNFNRLGRYLKGEWGAGKLTKELSAAASIGTKLKQVLLTLFGVIASGARIFLRFAGIAGIIYGIAEAFNALAKIFFDKDPFGWLQEKIKGAWDWLTKFWNDLRGIQEQEPLEFVDPSQVAIVDDINQQLEEQRLIRQELQRQAEEQRAEAERLEQKFLDFYNTLIDNAEDAALEQEHIDRAILKLAEDLASGAIELDVYNQAMKELEPSTQAITDALVRARDAVVDFNTRVAEDTNEIQKQLDQIGMTELERQLDDISRDMNLLADETLAKLQEELDAVGGAGTQAGQEIVAKMNEVKTATQKAIEEQQRLAEEAYETSRSFETGWNEAINSYIETATDGASQAKAVFDTMTKGMEDALVNFVKTGKLSFKDLISSIIEMIVRSQIQKMIATIFGTGAGGTGGGFFGAIKSIFGFADGGRPPVGRPSIVGERGPELFVPSTAGTIIPNEQLGMGGTVNNTYITNQISAIDAKSVAQLFAENRKTLLGTVQMAQKEMPYG